MRSRRIVINGKTYNNVDELPEDLRQKYEEAMRKLDQNQNGIPDILEGGNLFTDQDQNGTPDAFEALASLTGNPKILNAAKILANGQVYDNLDQLPPEVRAKYEQSMSKMDTNHNGIPDFMEARMNQSQQSQSSSSMMEDAIGRQANPNPFPIPTPSPASASRNPIPASPTIEPESTGNWIAAIAGIAMIGFCLLLAAAGVWYFFLR
jgi:phage-related protein